MVGSNFHFFFGWKVGLFRPFPGPQFGRPKFSNWREQISMLSRKHAHGWIVSWICICPTCITKFVPRSHIDEGFNCLTLHGGFLSQQTEETCFPKKPLENVVRFQCFVPGITSVQTYGKSPGLHYLPGGHEFMQDKWGGNLPVGDYGTRYRNLVKIDSLPMPNGRLVKGQYT